LDDDPTGQRAAGLMKMPVGFVSMCMKLGFDGFPDFQAKLLAKVEAHLHSPLLSLPAASPSGLNLHFLACTLPVNEPSVINKCIGRLRMKLYGFPSW
jgi:hypothetical protein